MRCPTCKNKVSPAIPGRCTNCPSGTAWHIEKLCQKCSTSLNQCCVCRKPLNQNKGSGK